VWLYSIRERVTCTRREGETEGVKQPESFARTYRACWIVLRHTRGYYDVTVCCFDNRCCLLKLARDILSFLVVEVRFVHERHEETILRGAGIKNGHIMASP
jgi:hypothetical protein